MQFLLLLVYEDNFIHWFVLIIGAFFLFRSSLSFELDFSF